jgi:hypothetical protein
LSTFSIPLYQNKKKGKRACFFFPRSISSIFASLVVTYVEEKVWNRSLWDLAQHLTTRANDSHAPLVSAFPKAPLSFKKICGMSSFGKVLRFASN